jgi:hypothetical protein
MRSGAGWRKFGHVVVLRWTVARKHAPQIAEHLLYRAHRDRRRELRRSTFYCDRVAGCPTGSWLVGSPGSVQTIERLDLHDGSSLRSRGPTPRRTEDNVARTVRIELEPPFRFAGIQVVGFTFQQISELVRRAGTPQALQIICGRFFPREHLAGSAVVRQITLRTFPV